MTPEHLSELAEARHRLENSGWVARVSSQLGQAVGTPLEVLPPSARHMLADASQKSIGAALNLALRSVDFSSSKPARPMRDRALAGISGAAGGAFGIGGLVAELPVSTTLMMRAIAEVAREQGEDLSTLEARLACLEVFALGGPSTDDDHSQGGYFALRAALARSIGEALKQGAAGAALSSGSSVFLRLIKQIAARFGVVVSQKAVVQAIPLLGALSASTINIAFTHHFQSVSKGHFTVRRLERLYGAETVAAHWNRS